MQHPIYLQRRAPLSCKSLKHGPSLTRRPNTSLGRALPDPDASCAQLRTPANASCVARTGLARGTAVPPAASFSRVTFLRHSPSSSSSSSALPLRRSALADARCVFALHALRASRWRSLCSRSSRTPRLSLALVVFSLFTRSAPLAGARLRGAVFSRAASSLSSRCCHRALVRSSQVKR